MRSNYSDSRVLGILNYGQGSTIAVEGTHCSTLRVLVAQFARLLALRLGAGRALAMKRTTMTPAMAMCPSHSASRRQRQQRWLPGVVVDSGTVGVC